MPNESQAQRKFQKKTKQQQQKTDLWFPGAKLGQETGSDQRAA